jgi:hypothetical protein
LIALLTKSAHPEHFGAANFLTEELEQKDSIKLTEKFLGNDPCETMPPQK